MKESAFSRIIGCVLLVTFFSSCAGFPAASQASVQGNQAISPVSPTVSPFFTGDGGEGMRLAVLIPEGRGLNSEQDYLPTLVQGVLVGDFAKYSAIEVLDRQRLETVLKETESGIYRNEADFGQLGEIANVDFALTGNITQTGSNYAVQIQVVGTGRETIGITKASHSGSYTIAELNDDFTGIRKVSLDLLSQMGVNLTAQAKSELSSAGTSANVNAETALARGITAQRQGTEVAALSYYFQAAVFDPSLLEAASRSSILNANISSGNIGSDVRNDIQWRRDWVARLTETEQLFDNINRAGSMPYTLFYTTEINQGTVNYQTETVNLSIETHLHGSGSWTLPMERTLQAVYDGLEATGRRRDWELASWPGRGVSRPNVFERRSSTFSVVFELLNDQNKVIGRQTLQTEGSWRLSNSSRPEIDVSADLRRTLNFQNVNANDISNSMTIRVATVNGTPAETAARNGVLQIRASNKREFDANDRFRFVKGEIRGFANNSAKTANLVIPNTVWGDPVISIGEGAFSGEGLTSVTIPDSVISIGEGAFRNNQLIGVTIPNNVTSIGNEAFTGNKLTSVNIGNNVTSIGAKAFYENRFTSVVIPDSVRTIGESAFETPQYRGGERETRYGITNVTIGENVSLWSANSFRNSWRYYNKDFNLVEGVNDSFVTYYNQNGRKAGTYNLVSNRWIYDTPGDDMNLKEAAVEDKKASIRGVILGLGLSALMIWLASLIPVPDK